MPYEEKAVTYLVVVASFMHRLSNWGVLLILKASPNGVRRQRLRSSTFGTQLKHHWSEIIDASRRLHSNFKGNSVKFFGFGVSWSVIVWWKLPTMNWRKKRHCFKKSNSGKSKFLTIVM